MKIGIGADHRGFILKQELLNHSEITHTKITWHDVGTHNSERTDYPPFAQAVARLLLNGEIDAGILLCGTGSGMAIAVNRFIGIYAAVAWNAEIAERAKREDNCNILILPADYLYAQHTLEIIRAWLNATFAQGRYAKRIDMLDV